MKAEQIESIRKEAIRDYGEPAFTMYFIRDFPTIGISAGWTGSRFWMWAVQVDLVVFRFSFGWFH